MLTARLLIPDSVIVQIRKVRNRSESTTFCLIRKLSWTETYRTFRISKMLIKNIFTKIRKNSGTRLGNSRGDGVDCI